MSRFRTSECRSCGATVVWASTLSGGRVPFNAEPIPKDQQRPSDVLYVLIERGPRDRPMAQLVGGTDPYVAKHNPHFQPHNETCPDADTWRGSS